jgi:hypothetical protein
LDAGIKTGAARKASASTRLRGHDGLSVDGLWP